jgi:glycosyltransferase involved in cell wall biosynthesis
MMRIAIDGHSIGTGLGGNESYARNLIEALAEIDATNQYTVYVTRNEALERYRGRWGNFSFVKMRPHTPIIRIPLALSIELRRRPVDLLHVQYTAPPFAPCKVVSTIHDLSFEHLPETFTRRGRIQSRLTIRRTAAKADHIIASSNYSRDDIIRTYRVRPEKVTAIPLAASASLKRASESDIERVRVKYSFAGRPILCVGAIQPRKNLVRLIQAYAALVHKRPDVPHLVIVGRKAWLSDETLKAATKGGLGHRIIFAGYAPDADLAGLYSAAACFVYPSYFEGFGLPPLEAMQCGAPVITGDLTSMPEVVGDAGLTVDPYDVMAIASAIERVITDNDLSADLSHRGLERAKLFSWKRTARETLAIYERVVAEKSPVVNT